MTQDLIAVLLEDHWFLDRLLDRFESTDDPAVLQRTFDDLCDAFARHEAVEGSLAAPHVPGAAADIDQLEQLLDEMRTVGPSSPAFRAGIGDAVDGIRAHLLREEASVLPVLRTLPTDTLVELGARALASRRLATPA